MRVAAKELTSLILDEERLRAERSDRKSWKSRVTGLEETGPPLGEPSSARRPRERRPEMTDEEDAEYRLALEASKYQEEEDRRRREGRGAGADDMDDDLAKAIKLSKEEEELRRRELEETPAIDLFDDTPTQTTQPQPTGFNGGYQQGNQVDWFANPVDSNQMQSQPTGLMPNAYTGYQQPQATGFPGTYNMPFGSQPTGMDPYNQQNSMQGFQPQPTGYNPYVQQQPMQQQHTMQMQSPAASDGLQPGSNNPWATSNQQQQQQQQQQQSLKPTPTGSNNPFAQFNRPSSANPTMNSLGAVPEQKSLSAFNNQPLQQPPRPQSSFGQSQTPFGSQQSFGNNNQQKEMNEHEAKLNTLLATGEGLDTYGNTGNLRIPAQHTAPGTFVNSAGAGSSQLIAEQTGNNPFLRQQFTGMPTVSYGSQPRPPMPTGPAAMNGGNNPFGGQVKQPSQQNQDLIQF